MTDRIKGLTVVLDEDYKDCDDAEMIINAIKMVKGVVKVEPSVATLNDFINRSRIATEYEARIIEVMNDFRDPELHARLLKMMKDFRDGV